MDPQAEAHLMAFYIRKAWGVCQRTERKVKLSDLIEDGEIPGLLVNRNDADKPHPQRRLMQIPPDLPPTRPSPPLDAEHATVKIGNNGDPLTGQAILNPAVIAAVTGVTVTVS
jgi:hypothetical protein